MKPLLLSTLIGLILSNAGITHASDLDNGENSAQAEQAITSQIPHINVISNETGFVMLFTDISVENIAAASWNGQDLIQPITAALNAELVEYQETNNGFQLTFLTNPNSIGLSEQGELEIVLKTGEYFSIPVTQQNVGIGDTRRAAQNSKCSISFGFPTNKATPNPGCNYGETKCYTTGKRHTGIDYVETGSALSVAKGTVLKVEPSFYIALGNSDHGMGNNVIIEHNDPKTCKKIYSTYSHLRKIYVKEGQSVDKGTFVGSIGGSGYGQTNYWGTHLHFEMKVLPTSGNPLGVGSNKSACSIDDKNAGPRKCWGYISQNQYSLEQYGYLNPNDYLGKTFTSSMPTPTPSAATMSPSSGEWKSAEQWISTAASNANQIYCRVTASENGEAPNPTPPTQSSHDICTKNLEFINGSSGSVQLWGASGKRRNIKVSVVGCNNSGCGQPNTYSYWLDLRPTSTPVAVVPQPVTPTPQPVQPAPIYRSISITNPSFGEKWKTDTTHDVKWSSQNLPKSARVSIELFNGSGWSTLEPNTSNDGSKNVDFRNNNNTCNDTKNARIRIRALEYSDVSSEQTFEIDHKKDFPKC